MLNKRLVNFIFLCSVMELSSVASQTEDGGMNCLENNFLPSFLEHGKRLAALAGEKIVSIRSRGVLGVKSKGKVIRDQDDPVTTADVASNNILLTGFRSLFNDLRIISEEGNVKDMDPGNKVEAKKVVASADTSHFICPGNVTRDLVLWLDPLDATKEFAEGGDLVKYVSVMACLVHRGKPVAGIIHFPFSKETLLSTNTPLIAKRNQERKVTAGDSENIGLIFSRSHDNGVAQQMKDLGFHVDAIKAAGSGYKASQVYKDSSVVYAHNSKIKKWDICAGDALLQSAGGGMLRWSGNRIDYSAESNTVLAEGMVATGDSFHFSSVVLKMKHRNTYHNLYLFGVLYAFAITAYYVLKRFLLKNKCAERSLLLRFFLYGTGTGDDVGATKDIESNTPKNKDKTRKKPTKFTALNSGTLGAFSFCFAGLQFCYLLWGVCQERMLTIPFDNRASSNPNEKNYFRYSQFLVFSNRVFAFAIAAVVYHFQNSRLSKRSSLDQTWPPFYLFSYSSLSNTISSWCQYEALKYVSFPEQVLFKSTKLIPVMIMGYIVNQKIYKKSEYTVSIVISVGVLAFLYGKDGGSNRGSHIHTAKATAGDYTGIFLLLLYVITDSFTSQWQGKLFSSYSVSKLQIMMGINFWSSCLTFCSVVFSGELQGAFKFLATHPEALRPLLALSCAGAFGQLFIYHTIGTFGPLVFGIIMTTRQILSLILSFVVFGHHISFLSFIGACIVFAGLAAKIHLKKGK